VRLWNAHGTPPITLRSPGRTGVATERIILAAAADLSAA